MEESVYHVTAADVEEDWQNVSNSPHPARLAATRLTEALHDAMGASFAEDASFEKPFDAEESTEKLLKRIHELEQRVRANQLSFAVKEEALAHSAQAKEAEIASLKTKLAEADKMNARTQAEVDKLAAENAALRKACKSTEAMVTKLQQRVELLQEVHEQSMQTLTGSQMQITALEEQLATTSARLSDMTDERDSTRTELFNAMTTITAMQKDMAMTKVNLEAKLAAAEAGLLTLQLQHVAPNHHRSASSSSSGSAGSSPCPGDSASDSATAGTSMVATRSISTLLALPLSLRPPLVPSPFPPDAEPETLREAEANRLILDLQQQVLAHFRLAQEFQIALRRHAEASAACAEPKTVVPRTVAEAREAAMKEKCRSLENDNLCLRRKVADLQAQLFSMQGAV